MDPASKLRNGQRDADATPLSECCVIRAKPHGR
jgi:hypothetical protein